MIIAVGFIACSDDDNDGKIIVDGDTALLDVSAGQLETLLAKDDVSGVKNVIIKGKMNLYDFQALSQVEGLENLDISGVSLKGGVFKENLCTFETEGEDNYYLWKWAFRALGNKIILRFPNLKSVVLPAHNKIADSGLFAHYTKLEKVVLSQDLSILGSKAFDECPLKTIYSKALVPPHVVPGTFSDLPTDCILYVPKGAKDIYMQADEWKEFNNIREE